MIQSLNKKIVKNETMTENEAFYFMESLVNDRVSDAEAISILSIMSYRGETAEEITGFVKAVRGLSKHVNKKCTDEIMDTCGTGGDGASTFNISTAVSIILSSLGIKVAKHGNKAVTSKSGSSDVLEALGINVATNSYEAISQLNKHDIAFLHAPYFHPSLKKVTHLRQQLPFRTIFNIIGPLVNPMSPSYQLIGVSDVKAAAAMAEAVKDLGIKKALLVTGKDGLDECSITGETKMFLVENGVITDFSFTPEEAGLKRGSLKDITVQGKQESAALITSILKGQGNESAKNIVILNAAAALFASNRVPGIREGVDVIKNCLRSGKAYNHLLSINKEEEKALVN